MQHLGIWLVLIAITAGCGQDRRTGGVSTRDSVPSVPLGAQGVYVDSAIPIEEALRRFRRDMSHPTGVSGGYSSREKLVRAFVGALEARDTSALREMVLRRDEFAWLYYPSSPLARPPYELPPALMWFQLQGESERGASRLLAERSGRTLGYVGHACGRARVEGDSRLYPNCEVRRLISPSDTVAERLFGLIIEHGGSYKLVSFANRLD